MTKHSYLFDTALTASIRVEAKSVEEARAMLRAALDCADTNFGAFPNGDPITGEVSGDYFGLVEIDGEEPTECPSCGAVEGEPEWGTVGDGADGYCPSCADKRDAETA